LIQNSKGVTPFGYQINRCTMKNYTSLTLPTELLKDIQSLGVALLTDAENGKQEIVDQGAIFRIMVCKGGNNICTSDIHNKMYQDIVDSIPVSIQNIITGTMMLNLKPQKFQRVHIDRSRECALNLPIKITPESHLGVYKFELNKNIPKAMFDLHPNDQNPNFDLDQDGEKYTMHDPVLLNTKSWHWVDNTKADSVRSIMSVDINDTPYAECIDIFKSEGWL